jgi:GT2 family glycosyltransferase
VKAQVVVITRNRRDQLAETLADLERLPERPPVIVVDNASTDGTATMVRTDFPAVRLVRAGANLGSSGRTVGVALATAPYVAFCDDDGCWLPGAIGRACAVLDAHPGVGAITGSVVVGPQRRPDPLSTVMAASPLDADAADLPGPGLIGMMAAATMVRRDAYLAARGFHPRFGVGGEEALLALDLRAAGWHVCYVPEVVVHHRPVADGRVPAARRRTVLRNDLWTAWLRYPGRAAVAWSARLLWAAARRHGATTAWAAWREAARGWRWVLDERAPLPAATMADVRLVRRSGR